MVLAQAVSTDKDIKKLKRKVKELKKYITELSEEASELRMNLTYFYQSKGLRLLITFLHRCLLKLHKCYQRFLIGMKRYYTEKKLAI